MGWFTQSNDASLAVTLARLERKIDALMASLGVEAAKDKMDDIRALAAAGQKIEAIKLYRERTGAGLADAKAAVERGV